jgi:hypothetical protein
VIFTDKNNKARSIYKNIYHFPKKIFHLRRRKEAQLIKIKIKIKTYVFQKLPEQPLN